MTYGRRQFEALDAAVRRLVPPLHAASAALSALVDADARAFEGYLVSAGRGRGDEGQGSAGRARGLGRGSRRGAGAGARPPWRGSGHWKAESGRSLLGAWQGWGGRGAPWA